MLPGPSARRLPVVVDEAPRDTHACRPMDLHSSVSIPMGQQTCLPARLIPGDGRGSRGTKQTGRQTNPEWQVAVSLVFKTNITRLLRRPRRVPRLLAGSSSLRRCLSTASPRLPRDGEAVAISTLSRPFDHISCTTQTALTGSLGLANQAQLSIWSSCEGPRSGDNRSCSGKTTAQSTWRKPSLLLQVSYCESRAIGRQLSACTCLGTR